MKPTKPLRRPWIWALLLLPSVVVGQNGRGAPPDTTFRSPRADASADSAYVDGVAPPDTAYSFRDGVGRLVRVRAADDTTGLDVPSTFEPSAAGRRRFLRPTPGAKADSLFGISAFDAFLLPPRGPSLVFDRTDLRFTGFSEWWEIAKWSPGVFSLEPGYLGTTNTSSFHNHGPDGTLVAHEGRPLQGGLFPVEKTNAIGKGPLTGASVMRVGASHLYGPGAGAGAILFSPLAYGTDRPYSDVSWSTGIFGQSTNAVTAALRAHRFGVVFNYDAEHAQPWSVFDGFRAERYYGRVDWAQPGTRISAWGRLDEARLRGIERISKRSDDTEEAGLGVEQQLGSWIGAARLYTQVNKLRADGTEAHTYHELRRRGGDVLLSGHLTRGWRIGGMAGAWQDRFLRQDGSLDQNEIDDVGGFALGRTTIEIMGMTLDAAVRVDRLSTGQEVVAPGATLNVPLGRSTDLWAHAARTNDRPVYFHRINDFFNAVNYGTDLPRPEGQPIPGGQTVAVGVRHDAPSFLLDLAVVGEVYDRVFDWVPEPYEGPLNLDEPTDWTQETVEAIGGWGAIDVPIQIPSIRGGVLVGGSGFVGTIPDQQGLQMEPWRYGEAHGRLRVDAFGGALRLEGELMLVALGEMRTPFGALPGQFQVVGRANARIGDAVLFYRSENVFSNEQYLSSAYDESIGFVPITSRNVRFGVSWILLD